ncbi:MAG: SDR family oxidoreductase [Acidimicrobiia bacterium]|nr:SDR family oxidoreductase [Acidimicrobiia bacterium]
MSDPYRSHSFDELCRLPTAYRDDLFNGQVVLITGGGGAIGTAMATLFGRLGASIVACGRTAETLDTLVDRLASIEVEAHAVPMTIRDPEQVDALIATAWDRFGRLDVVINNAGGQFSSPALDITPKGWHAVVETNLYGTWYTMQAAARRWVAEAERGNGAPGNIINISTIQGRAGVGIPHTVASRAGGVALSRSLAVEWAPYGIRVNSIAVGVIASEGLKTYPEEAKASFGHNPMRRLGDVWDVAQGAAYLAGPTGEFVNGTHLEITGGEHVWGEYWPLGKPDYFRLDLDDDGDGEV